MIRILLGFVTIQKLNTSRFWQRIRNISTLIERLDISNFSSTTNLLLDNEYLKQIKMYTIPSGNYTIDFCFTFPLPDNISLQRISISYLAEINIYFHYPGQFINTWQDQSNIVSTSNKLIMKFQSYQLNWHDLGVNFLIDKQNGLKNRDDISSDDCALNLEIDFNHKLKDYLMGNSNLFLNNNRSLKNNSLVVNRFYDILNHLHTNCSKPADTIQIRTIPFSMKQHQNLNIDIDLHNLNTTFTEDIDWKYHKTKPKVIINIPRFSKITKVNN